MTCVLVRVEYRVSKAPVTRYLYHKPKNTV